MGDTFCVPLLLATTLACSVPSLCGKVDTHMTSLLPFIRWDRGHGTGRHSFMTVDEPLPKFPGMRPPDLFRSRFALCERDVRYA